MQGGTWNACLGSWRRTPSVSLGVIANVEGQLSPTLVDEPNSHSGLAQLPNCLSLPQQVTGCVHKLDHWLEMVIPGAATLQRVFPGQIVEYKSLRAAAMEEGVLAWNVKNLRSRGARIVCFPLEPKPHQVSEDWLQEMWRVDIDEGRGV